MLKNPSVKDVLKLTISDGENPISGASVTIDDDTKTSGEDGVVEYELAYGDYTAAISADGYTSAEETLAFRSNHKNFTVTLTAEAENADAESDVPNGEGG